MAAHPPYLLLPLQLICGNDTILSQTEWYHVPYFSVPPLGGRKVAKIKYNNRILIAVIIHLIKLIHNRLLSTVRPFLPFFIKT
jgi:hypothetical protein